MALSNEDRLAVFTILGIPVTKPSEFYSDLSSKETVNRNALLYMDHSKYLDYPYEYDDAAINAVNARIDGLSADEESRVSDIISQWTSIEFSVVRVKTDKVSLNYDEQRSHLRKLLKIIIPIDIVGGLSQGSPMVSIG